MNEDAAPTPRNTRWVSWLGILPVPAALLIVIGVLSSAKGPFWLDTNLDPDYAYLLNGLNITEGQLPGHVDHPGTPVQILDGWVINAVAHATGHGEFQSRREDMLTRPEFYLNWCARLYVLIFLLAALGIGALVFHLTRNALWAAAAQSPALLAVQAPLSLTCVKPEPLLLSLGLCMGLITLLHGYGSFRSKDGRVALLFGLTVGLGIATKVTFLPLVILPLIVLNGIWPRLLYMLTAGLSLFVATLPIHLMLDTMKDWFTGLATHTGGYGNGPRGFIDPLEYVLALGRVAVMEIPFTLIVVASFVVLLLTRKADLTDSSRALRRCLWGVTLTELAQILLVAKHPWHGEHYLVPSLALMGVNLVLIAPLIGSNVRDRARKVAVGLVVCATLFQVWSFLALRGELLEHRRDSESVDSFLNQFPDATVAAYYPASSQVYALQFGNRFAVANYSDSLMKLYPHVILYHQWFRMFVNYRGGIPDAQMAALAGASKLLIRGAELGKDLPSGPEGSPFFPPGARLELLFSTHTECVYRVTAWPEK